MSWFLILLQLILTVVMGVYFCTQLRAQQRSQPAGRRDSTAEMSKLTRMRSVSLSRPLCENVRPTRFAAQCATTLLDEGKVATIFLYRGHTLTASRH